jgi:hypothetical protein
VTPAAEPYPRSHNHGHDDGRSRELEDPIMSRFTTRRNALLVVAALVLVPASLLSCGAGFSAIVASAARPAAR